MADTKYLTVKHLSRSELARVFSRIDVSAAGCWLWTGGLTSNGYSKIKFRKRTESVHRLMWAWLVGPLPRGQGREIPNIDHAGCDTKRCCNPRHMKLVPPRENILRSNGPAAQNARRTHCKKGHELARAVGTSEGRTCPQCRNEWHESVRYTTWNAEFGRAYHQAQRYGPNRQAFLARKRAVMREWRSKLRSQSH